MKKIVLLLIAVALMSVNGFTQSQSAELRNLQGTWALIGLLNDSESYNEADVKAENLEVYYIFTNNSMTIRKPDGDIGPVNFVIENAYLRLGSGNNAGMLPFNLQGNILIIHEGGYAFIYRKR
ncbi:MAG: hypothetical protein FWD26_01205 [Treponema sp.]|nr:hypothetical protein [Treponema sp.]